MDKDGLQKPAKHARLDSMPQRDGDAAAKHIPWDVARKIVSWGGFQVAAAMACCCRDFTGLLRQLAADTNRFGPALHFTENPKWLIEHESHLRTRIGVQPTALARLAEESAASVNGEAAVRLLGLAAERGALGLFRTRGGNAGAQAPLLQRARTAALLAARPGLVATPHFDALLWHCSQQRAAADLLYTVGAVASLAEPAAEASSSIRGHVLEGVCERGQTALLQQLLACPAFIALNGRDTAHVLYSACYAGNMAVLQQLLVCPALLERLETKNTRNVLRDVCKAGQSAALQHLLACPEFIARLDRLDSWDTAHVLYSACDAGNMAMLQQLLACPALLERLDSWHTRNVLRDVCKAGQSAALHHLLACPEFIARLDRLDSWDTRYVLQSTCDAGNMAVLQQLLACHALLERLDSWHTRNVLRDVCKAGQSAALHHLLACAALLQQLSRNDALDVLQTALEQNQTAALQQLQECTAFMEIVYRDD